MAESTPLESVYATRQRGLGGSNGGKRGQHFHYAEVCRNEEAGNDRSALGECNLLLLRALRGTAVLVAFAVAVVLLTISYTESEGSSYRGMLKLDATGNGVSDGSDGFVLVATNEYGEYDRGALALYGFDMLVEPYKETTISVVSSSSPSAPSSVPSSSVSYNWFLVREDDESDVIDVTVAESDDTPRGSSVKVTLTEAGTRYSLRVQQQQGIELSTLQAKDGASTPSTANIVVWEKTIVVTCKYVRRELRDLTAADSTAFFSAMREFYTVELEHGKEKYGKTFANSKIMSAYHNSRNFCFHSGMHFLNAHASFDLWAERSLQMIDPTVALHYWDFTIDAGTLGANWAESEVFSKDMYGSALGSPDNGYQISEGWFAGVKSIYDPDETFLAEFISPGHSIYGYIDSLYNFQAVDGVSRTASYCGLKGQLEFASCRVLINCFEAYDNIYDWNVCMEDQVHAANHGMIEVPSTATYGAISRGAPRVWERAFDLRPGVHARQQVAGQRPHVEIQHVRSRVHPGQTERCRCTCTTDLDDWSDDEVYDMMENAMLTMANRAHGAKYVYLDDSATYPYGFMQDGKRLGYDQNMLLLRTLLWITCEPGALGAMSVGPSILDPVFWALHPLFEKGTQILQLSPTYKDTYDFTWVGKDCGDGVSGGQIDETLPFTERDFGFGDADDFLTNQEIIELLFPTNPKLPYVYDKFDTWGACTDWDFEVATS